MNQDCTSDIGYKLSMINIQVHIKKNTQIDETNIHAHNTNIFQLWELNSRPPA